MKQPAKRKSRQSAQARKVLDDSNLGQMNISIDKSLRNQFLLCTGFLNTSMNQAIKDYIQSYVDKHFHKVIAGCENLEEQAKRRG